MDDIAASTPELTPEKRADRAWPAIYAYAFEGQDGVMATSELQTKVSDMLVDLMHFCDVQRRKDASGQREGWSWEALLAQAETHYEAETYDSPCDHYDTWTVWEDTIYSRYVQVDVEDGKPVRLNIGDGSTGDGSNDRICCGACGRVFPLPDVEVDYV